MVSKIIKFPYWIFCLNLMTISGFIKNFIITDNMTLNWDAILSESFFNMIVQLITTIILFLLLKSYYKLKVEHEKTTMEQEIGIIVSFHRINQAFLRDYEGYKALQLPNEKYDNYWQRTPDGLFAKYLTEEYKSLKSLLSDNFKDKTVAQIEASLKKYYPDDFIDNFITTKQKK